MVKHLFTPSDRLLPRTAQPFSRRGGVIANAPVAPLDFRKER